MVDGRDRDKDKDNRVVVARRAVVTGDKADLVPIVVISVASSVTVGRSVLFVPSKEHLYHLGALITRAALHHFRVHRDRPSSTSLVSPPLIRPSNSTNTNIILKCLVTWIICQDIRHHLGVRLRPGFRFRG